MSDKNSNSVNIDDANSKVSPELIGMSKADALKYLELADDAGDYQIDEAFWKLSKNARKIKDDSERDQRIIDITYAYDVATGKEEKRIKALQERAAAKKYFGKTAAEWKVYFGYTWYRYLIVLFIIVCIGMIVYRIAFAPDEDVSVLSIGHFDCDVEVLENRLKDEGMKNPFVNTSNLVVPNDQGEMNGSYADMTSAVLFASEPDIVITDEMTAKYFFDQFEDMSLIYEHLQTNVSPDILSKIEPVYCTEYEALLISVEYLESQHMEADRDELVSASHDKVLIGLKITDEDLIRKLGFLNLWPESPATLIIGLGTNCRDFNECEEIITSIVNEVTK